MDDDGLMVSIVGEQFERVAAKHDLEALGISPTSADISAWMAADNRAKRRLAMAWAVLCDEVAPPKGKE